MSMQAVVTEKHLSSHRNPLHARVSLSANPDAALLALGRDFQAVAAESEAASAESARLYNVFCEAARSLKPEALRFRPEDRDLIGFWLHPEADDEGVLYHSNRDMAGIETATHLHDPVGAARAAEIVAAWDGRQDAREAMADKVGYSAACFRSDALYEESCALLDEIRDARALTREGMQVKLNALRWLYREDDLDELDGGATTDVQIAFSIVRDLLRMSAH